MLFGIISIALAAVIALIGIPAIIGQTNTKTNIVRVKTDIEKGTVITAEQLEMAEVSTHGLPANVATDTAQVIGKYAAVDLVAGDYFLPTKISITSLNSDEILSKLKGDKIAVSMSVQSLAGTLSNKLRTDDIIAIYTFVDGETVKPEELQYVRIIAISNSNGTNIEDAVGDESRMASTITFLVNDRQAAKMIEIENSSRMHIALISRDDTKRAKELLAEQEEILEQIELEESEEEGDLDFDFDFDFDFETETGDAA